jgi:hypothetical protein
MAASGERIRRVSTHPAFVVLVGIIATLTLCCGIFYGLSETVFSCEHKGFVYPHQGSEFYHAQVVSVDCGATSNFDARVVLSTPNQGRRENREAVFMSNNVDPTTVTLTWESKDHLVIGYEYSYYANITKALPTWRGVTITYRGK